LNGWLGRASVSMIRVTSEVPTGRRSSRAHTSTWCLAAGSGPEGVARTPKIILVVLKVPDNKALAPVVRYLEDPHRC
jgi:hypothetical protein